MPNAALIVFYVVGAGLEVGGILLVVAEMRADRRHALEVAGISIPTVGHDPLANWPKSPSWSIRGAIDKDRKLQPQRAQAEVSRRLQDALVGILTGNQRLRVWGVRLCSQR